MQKVFISNFLAALIVFSSARAATDMQFTLVRNYLIVVPVTINGAGPYEFLLDTGTNTTLLHTEFAQQISLRPTDRIELVTVAGSEVIPRAKLQSLTLGNKSVNDLEVLFSDLRGVRSVLPKVRGVLGQNFLSQFNYLVDYPNRRISFVDEAEVRWCGTQLPFVLHEGRILITVEPGLQLMLDSAIADLLLLDATAQRCSTGSVSDLGFDQAHTWENSGRSRSPYRTNPTCFDVDQNSLRPMQLKSDLGSREVWQARLRTFRIGEMQLQNLPITFLNQKPSDTGRVEDGLLPMSLFQSIYINHQQGYVILNPKPLPNQSTKLPLDNAATTRR